MKKTAALLLIFLVSLTIKAQDAESLFRAAVEKIKGYDNIEIQFEYSMINPEAGINETLDGSGFLKGEEYKLNIMGQEIICDGTTLWTYDSDNEEVIISNVNDEENASPLSLLNSFNENITARFISQNNNDIKTIEVTSVSSDVLEKIIVSIEPKTLMLKDLTVSDENNTKFVYVIKKFVMNQKLSEGFFTFKASDHPDAEIIDMR
ncbi:MAG: outer membrane lipoprotein carrier protein LolA [Candidatus Limimorpha sp.]